MSGGSAALRRKLGVAADLRGVVRTMKAMAASSIRKYEQAVLASAKYDGTIKLGLAAALRACPWRPAVPATVASGCVSNVIVMGSNQGLVGRFNDVIAEFSIETLAKLPGSIKVWAVGERVGGRLVDAGVTVDGMFPVPNDVSGITDLVSRLQLQTENPHDSEQNQPVYVLHNRQTMAAAYEPTSRRLLPLDDTWRVEMIAADWPAKRTPQLLGAAVAVLRSCVREYLFMSLFQACAESLASENASRLAAMQRAEKNIDEITQELTGRFHRVRQTSIDEELFDVVSGFDALIE